MKLSELFLDRFLETKLFEMAYSRHQAWMKCDSLVPPLTEHILKVLIMPTSRYVKHWTDEIQSYLSIMNKIKVKPSGKHLSASTYKEWLVDTPDFDEEAILADVKTIRQKYQGEKAEFYDNVFSDYRRVMEQLCVDLGEGSVDRTKLEGYLKRSA